MQFVHNLVSGSYLRLVSGVIAVVLLASSWSSLAVMVATVGGGATNLVFYDDYEHNAVDVEPTNATVGAWAFTSFFSHTRTNVPPGDAAAGIQYLRMSRPPGGGTTIVADYGARSSASFSDVISS